MTFVDVSSLSYLSHIWFKTNYVQWRNSACVVIVC